MVNKYKYYKQSELPPSINDIVYLPENILGTVLDYIDDAYMILPWNSGHEKLFHVNSLREVPKNKRRPEDLND